MEQAIDWQVLKNTLGEFDALCASGGHPKENLEAAQHDHSFSYDEDVGKKTRPHKVKKRKQDIEKNRESARESRKRKKNYVSTLESKIVSLESEVERLRRKLNQY